MAYGVDRYPNPPQDAEDVEVYYEREDGDIVRRVVRNREKDSEDQE